MVVLECGTYSSNSKCLVLTDTPRVTVIVLECGTYSSNSKCLVLTDTPVSHYESFDAHLMFGKE